MSQAQSQSANASRSAVCGAEAADRLGIITGRDSGPVLFGPHINAGRVEVTVASWGGKASDTARFFPLAGSHGSLQNRVGKRRQWVGERRGLKHSPKRDQDDACHQRRSPQGSPDQTSHNGHEAPTRRRSHTPHCRSGVYGTRGPSSFPLSGGGAV